MFIQIDYNIDISAIIKLVRLCAEVYNSGSQVIGLGLGCGTGGRTLRVRCVGGYKRQGMDVA